MWCVDGCGWVVMGVDGWEWGAMGVDGRVMGGNGGRWVWMGV